jgi:hypothetical protein
LLRKKNLSVNRILGNINFDILVLAEPERLLENL